jgi:hypothetical protein
MIRTLRVTLSAIGLITALLGLWGILSNSVLYLFPDYWSMKWNLLQGIDDWDASKPFKAVPMWPRNFWWAISLDTPCPSLDPWLLGPVGYGFYALCFVWGMGSTVLLRSWLQPSPGAAFWRVFIFCAWWLIGLGGIVAHVMFFWSIAIEADRAGW